LKNTIRKKTNGKKKAHKDPSGKKVDLVKMDAAANSAGIQDSVHKRKGKTSRKVAQL